MYSDWCNVYLFMFNKFLYIFYDDYTWCNKEGGPDSFDKNKLTSWYSVKQIVIFNLLLYSRKTAWGRDLIFGPQFRLARSTSRSTSSEDSGSSL